LRRPQVVLLGQKRAVAVMCCQKIACFEALRLHEDAVESLRELNVTIGAGDVALLQGERSVAAAQSSAVGGGGRSEGGTTHEEEEFEVEGLVYAAAPKSVAKYPFQMALPPPGTHCFEDDLQFLIREGASADPHKDDAPLPLSTPKGLALLPGDARPPEPPADRARRLAVEALIVNQKGPKGDGGGPWLSVRAVLTTDRTLHLFDASLPDSKEVSASSAAVSSAAAALGAALSTMSAGAGKGVESTAAARGVVGAHLLRSVNCRRASFAVEAITAQAAQAAESGSAAGTGSGSSPAALCFEITVASGSLLKKFNLFSGDGLDHFVFQAANQRQLEVGFRARERACSLCYESDSVC
jgi:hypothetical protein